MAARASRRARIRCACMPILPVQFEESDPQLSGVQPSDACRVCVMLAHSLFSTRLGRQAAERILRTDDVIEVGPGIRPMTLWKPARYVAIEPHEEYCSLLRKEMPEAIVVQGDASELAGRSADSVLFLDVLEHMEKEQGTAALNLARCAAERQIVVFTPLGFMPQPEDGDSDAWGYQGQHWQRHRSGWAPEEFDGWDVMVEECFHRRDGKYYGAFFAVLTL